MSDYRVIAAVTATLQNLLTDAIREAMPGATVQTGPPDTHPPDQVAEGLVKIFLFKVEPNATWRNAELPVRGADGTLIRRPQLAINVDYLLSFYGDERRKVPYLLLGLVLAALHAEPYPTLRHMPRSRSGNGSGAEADPVSAGLAGSGLEHQRQPLSFTMLPLTHEELIPLFSQLPFVMSVAYRAQAVLVEPLAVPEPPLPVRRVDLHVAPRRRPVLAGVEPRVLPFHPAVPIHLEGQGLAVEDPGRERVAVRFGDLRAEPVAVDDRRIEVGLPEDLQAGTHLVRVVHRRSGDGSAPRHDVVESNPVALVVEPVVLEAAAARLAVENGPPPTSAGSGAPLPGRGPEVPDSATRAGAGTGPVQLRVRFRPAVTAATSAVLLLNEEVEEQAGEDGSSRRPRSYALPVRVGPEARDRLTVEAPVAPGRYLLRLQMGGVTSRLREDGEGQGWAGPRVDVP